MASIFRSRQPDYRALNPNGSQEAALTAAGFRVKQKDADVMRRLIQPWQVRSFSYYDIIPEVKFASLFYSRGLGPLRLFAAERDEKGNIEETDNPDAIAMLERMKDPGGGGRERLQSAYGKLQFIAGECMMFCSRERDEDQGDEEGTEQWEMLSTDELRVTGAGSYTRFKAPSLGAEQYWEPPEDAFEPVKDDQAVAYRLWRPHPRFSYLADSTMQGVLDICEELYLLTLSIRARARSRLAGPGILIVNGKYIPAPPAARPGENPQNDPFMTDVIKNFTAGLQNEGSAATQVPHIVRVDAENLDNVMKHIQVIDPMQFYPETGVRMELIKRLAIGLDMPPEVLLGLSDANQWSAWAIDEQSWKSHLQPVANQMVYDMTSAYYQPSLKAEEVEGWDRFVIAYDATAVINHPDRSKDAKELQAAGLISDESARAANGFTEDDKPSEEELNRYVGIKLRDGSYVKYGEPSLKPGGIEVGPHEILTGEGAATTADQIGEGGTRPPSDVTDGAGPETAPEPPAVTAAAMLAAGEREMLATRIVGACDVAAFRAREVAGARLRGYAKRDPGLFAELAERANRDVAAIVGRERARRISGMSDQQLVGGVRDLLEENLARWTVSPETAALVIDRVEKHAAATLYEKDPRPLSQGFWHLILDQAVGR